MKTKLLLLSIILNLCPFFAAAHDIEVKNSQGKTIYYNYSEDGMVLYVTYRDNYSGSYSGNIIIPEEVTYMNRIRKVAAIGNHAFQGCSRLTSITIPNSVKIIGNDAFKDCSGLTSVTLPNSVIRIGDRAFAGCLSLFSFTIPNKVSVIGISAFAGCSGLASVIIGNSVTDIGSYAFKECSLLTSITLPKGVRSIGDGAFYGCSLLTSIAFPNTLTSIGGSAFAGCNDLSSIFLLFLNPFAIYGKNSEFRTFSLDVFNNVTLYVPAGTLHEFKLTDGWKDFLFIEEDASLGIKKII